MSDRIIFCQCMWATKKLEMPPRAHYSAGVRNPEALYRVQKSDCIELESIEP